MKPLFPLLFSSVLACSSLESMAAIDLILHNAKVYTAEPAQGLQQALAVEAGKIVAVGRDTDVLRLRQAGTQVLDLGGKVLMPGFIDSHAHAVKGGLQLGQMHIDGQQLAIAELERHLREDRARQGDVLLISGMPSADWSRLDEFEHFNRGEWAARPIVLLGWDQHTGWANDTMLARAGIDAARVKRLSPEERDTIGHDPDGQPNGFLAEAGLYSVLDQLPTLTEEQLLAAARAAIAHYQSLGVTAWMDPLSNDAPGQVLNNSALGVLPIYRKLAQQGELNAHVAALLGADSKATPADLDELDKVRQQFQGIANLSLPGIKIFADGVPEFPAQSAAMLAPYKNSNKRGELLIDPEHFGELVDAADARGWLVHIHAIGDRAVRESLNGIEQARQQRSSGIPHSITHLQMVNPKEFARFKALGVIASMQLYWAAADELTHDLVQPYISAMAFQHQYPARSLLKQGATIAGASDWPVTTAEPWKAIYQAVSRKGPKGVLNADEAIDREIMFQAYTLNAARALLLDNKIGSLKPGKQADLIVLDRDVFQVEPEQLAGTRVLKTYFAGREVFSR